MTAPSTEMVKAQLRAQHLADAIAAGQAAAALHWHASLGVVLAKWIEQGGEWVDRPDDDGPF